MDYYNRYGQFLLNGEQTVVPGLNLPRKSTDIKYVFRAGVSRLDKIFNLLVMWYKQVY